VTAAATATATAFAAAPLRSVACPSSFPLGTIDEAAAQSRLRKLPSLGANTARKLIARGIMTLPDLAEDVRQGGAASGEVLNPTQLSCLGWYQELTEGVTAGEVEEMQAAVLDAAQRYAVTRSNPDPDLGWEIIAVGGGRRSDASHDADFLLANPRLPKGEDLNGILRNILFKLGNKVMGGDAAVEQEDAAEVDTSFHKVSEGNMPKMWRRLNEKGVKPDDDAGLGGGGQGFRGNADYYDKFYGIFCTAAGKHRRIDIVLVPYEQLTFAMIGWTGSKQYNRWMRQHASDR
jgi:DNA polymerase mu